MQDEFLTINGTFEERLAEAGLEPFFSLPEVAAFAMIRESSLRRLLCENKERFGEPLYRRGACGRRHRLLRGSEVQTVLDLLFEAGQAPWLSKKGESNG